MKALTSTPTGNVVPAANYTAGSYTLTGLVVGKYYYYSMGTNDTSIAFAGGATHLKSASATGVFVATATSATLAGSGTSAVGTAIYPILGVPLYATTFTPSLPTRQVTVGQFPAANPNFSRAIQLSDEAVYVKRGSVGVALSLADLINIALTDETGLTWTPPVVLTQPANASCVHSSTSATFTVDAGSEYDLTYQWYESDDGTFGVGHNTALSSSGIYAGATSASLVITPTDTTKTGYSYRCAVTDNAGSYGLTNGSVTTAAAVLTVT